MPIFAIDSFAPRTSFRRRRSAIVNAGNNIALLRQHQMPQIIFARPTNPLRFVRQVRHRRKTKSDIFCSGQNSAVSSSNRPDVTPSPMSTWKNSLRTFSQFVEFCLQFGIVNHRADQLFCLSASTKSNFAALPNDEKLCYCPTAVRVNILGIYQPFCASGVTFSIVPLPSNFVR